MRKKIALIVGRFQPFHKGHLFLIKKALENGDKIVMGIGSANIIDVNNPIDFETRKKVIKAVFYKEKIEDKLLKIVPLDDFFDDKKWLVNIRKQVGKFDIVVSNNDWTNKIMEKAGISVLRIPYFKRELYEGWRIRKLIQEGKKWQDRVPNYLVEFVSNYPLRTTPYNLVVVGGTFDHFHAGHEALLKKAFEIGKKVTVGIATKEIYKNKFLSETIESFEERKKSVSDFLTKKNWIEKAKLIPFSEFTGGTDKLKDIDAIVVSKETFPNAIKINELRKKNHLKPMLIVIVEDVLAEDGKIISSEGIRAGEIDREGKSYKIQNPNDKQNPKSKIQEIIMPENIRPILQKPLGVIFKSVGAIFKSPAFKSPKKPTLLIAVGDIIVDSLLKEGIDPDVKIIDFKSRRKRTDLFAKLEHVKKGPSLYNDPGTINLKTAETLRQMIRKRSVGPYGSWLVVDGEEDLLTLPAILFTPLGSLVLYGHWQYGIIAVEVDKEMKEKVRKIIKKFKNH